ncbi:MAG: hypothetical protein Q9186_007160 [Xanthomendoza sp. 1 TL-2023]
MQPDIGGLGPGVTGTEPVLFQRPTAKSHIRPSHTGACCVVRTVLNDQALPRDFTWGGIPNWYWRLFEVQLGIIAACIPTLRPGYSWSQKKLRSYIRSYTRSNRNNRFSKGPPPTPTQHMEEAKTARHLRAHPANVYSDPPMLLESDNTTMVEGFGRGLDLPPRADPRRQRDSTQGDLESQREFASQSDLEEQPEEDKVRQRASLKVDLRPKFGIDRVDQSLERVDPAT